MTKKSERTCLRCCGPMARGHFQTLGAGSHRLQFVVPGVATSWNPVKAFKQGLDDERGDRTFDLSGMCGYLCKTCGLLELHAWPDEEPDDTPAEL